MVYLEYEFQKAKFHEVQRVFNELLNEKERLFTKTQPKAITYDKDRVQGGEHTNVLDDYVIAKEEKRIDEKLVQIRQLLDDREKLLDLKERELRKSQDKMDMIYVFRFLDGYSINRIAKALNYSKSQVYRMFCQIQSKILKDGTKCDKNCGNI